MKAKALARKLEVGKAHYNDFRRALRELVKQGRIEFCRNHVIRPVSPHGTVVGTFRRLGGGERRRP